MAAASRLWNSLPVCIRSACTTNDFKQKLKPGRHFYSARHFISIISLYLGFYIVFLQITFIIAIVISFSVVFVFDSIVIVNTFLILFLYLL